jgi:hypothetical protein
MKDKNKKLEREKKYPIIVLQNMGHDLVLHVLSE